MNSDMVITVDTEAVGLLPDIRKGHREDLHVIHCKEYNSGELFTFFDDYDARINPVWMDEFEEEGFKAGDLRDGIQLLNECNVLIMQNITGFDELCVNKAFGKRVFDRDHLAESNNPVFPFKTADTLVMSQLLNPERKVDHRAYTMGLSNMRAHSIEAFGIMMGRFKPEHEDWSHLSQEMIHRCSEDVEIGEFMFNTLMKEWHEQIMHPAVRTGLSIADAYRMEFQIAYDIACQGQRGFAIDVGYISELVQELDEKIEATEKSFRPHMPMRLKKKKLELAYVEKCSAEMVFQIALNHGNSYCQAVANNYEKYMNQHERRGSYAATQWQPTTKAGKYKKIVTKYIPEAVGFAQDHAVLPIHGPFTPLVWEEIPLGNRDAVKQILYKHGWLGVNYNETEETFMEENEGQLPKPWSGKIDDDSIADWEDRIGEIPEWCKGIADWYVLNSRRNQLLNPKDVVAYDLKGQWPRQASKKNECRGILPQARCYNEDSPHYLKTAQELYEMTGHWPVTGHWRVPAIAFPIGTNTFRMRHKVVVNIPSRGLYGKEMRKCFIAGPGKKVLGCDGSGLELRMLAHFMNDPEYISVLLDGDIHTHNQDMATLPTRDKAKKFIYMFLYGAGIPNLAKQLGLTEREMANIKKNFETNLPKLKLLMDRVEAAAKAKGYLLSQDGRWGRIRSDGNKLKLNTALNVLLQMTGSLCMKWGHIFAEEMNNGQLPMIAHVHDEAQMEIDEEDIDIIAYGIKKEEWKEEEKRQYVDDAGRIWSAPVLANPKEDLDNDGIKRVMVERMYHPFGDMYVKGIKKAGEFLKMRLPLDGEYKIGDSWAETH